MQGGFINLGGVAAGGAIGFGYVGLLYTGMAQTNGFGLPDTITRYAIPGINYAVAFVSAVVGAFGVAGRGPTRNHQLVSDGLIGFGVSTAIAQFFSRY